MIQIEFRNREYEGNLNAEDCMELFFTIMGDAEDKVKKLDEKTGVSSFIDECDELGKYLDNGRSRYTECYTESTKLIYGLEESCKKNETQENMLISLKKPSEQSDLKGVDSCKVKCSEYIKLDNQGRKDFIKKCIEVEDFASESFQKLSSQDNFVMEIPKFLQKKIQKDFQQGVSYPTNHSFNETNNPHAIVVLPGSPNDGSPLNVTPEGQELKSKVPDYESRETHEVASVHSVHTTHVSSGVEDISRDVTDDIGNLQISRNDYTTYFFVAPSAFNITHSLYEIILNNIIMHPINKPSALFRHTKYTSFDLLFSNKKWKKRQQIHEELNRKMYEPSTFKEKRINLKYGNLEHSMYDDL
ncbi:hypothetical protein POCGH01_00208300 [Plasmodium ovale]|uniref:PIR protein n=1 Tax=Plasmodium ovale TaxID=36330 RepID=A0A1D3JFM5_PLAOA|nr:hypothetical protein POCGH01_00208300 [Plasmodium ovale]